jgi:hypothetical protein
MRFHSADSSIPTLTATRFFEEIPSWLFGRGLTFPDCEISLFFLLYILKNESALLIKIMIEFPSC